jgi:type I restriction enzyme S subunit
MTTGVDAQTCKLIVLDRRIASMTEFKQIMILARAFPVALTLREVTINQDMKSLSPSEPELRDFLLIALRALEPKVLSAIERSSHGTCKLRTEVLESILIPVPPLSEQRRIAAKVDQLMTLVDQLESQLAASEKAANELLDAVVHELLHPTAAVFEFPRSESDGASKRTAIGCYAIEHLARNPSFGRVMLMKVCYLAETHLGLPLGWQPMRQAAGPWDPCVQDFESLGTQSDWFAVNQKTLKNGHIKIEYSRKKALKTKAGEAITVLGSQKAEFDRLLNLFADKNTEEAEIITTLFAAWNDFLIDGKTPTDAEIIHELRANWHQSKERFTPALLQRWLHWMRSYGLVPIGHHPRTRQQLALQME